jgi:hypothetical protein
LTLSFSFLPIQDQYLFIHRAISEFYNPPSDESAEKATVKGEQHYANFGRIRELLDEPDEYN